MCQNCPSTTTENTEAEAMTETTLVTCDICQSEVEADTITHYNDEAYCESCRDDELVTLHSGDLCHVDYAVYIESEGEYYEENDRRIVYTVDTNEHELSSNCIYSDITNQWYTREGYWGEHFECEECCETFHNDEYSHDGLCNGCAENQNNQASVKNYNDDVLDYLELVAPSKKERPYTLGVELEVEDAEDYDTIAELFSEDAILKEDGSLDNGAEIVTRPLPYEQLRDRVFTQEKLKVIVDMGGRSFNTTTAGLHVHIGRKYLTQAQIARIVVFIHNPDNADFIKAIAQRDHSRWASASDSKSLCLRDSQRNGASGRYTAVNLQNTATIEIRIFKGTLAREGILRALQFTLALCDFTRAGTRSISRAHRLDDFLSFVSAERKQYPQFDAWLVKKGWYSKPYKATYSPTIKGRESEAKIKQRKEAAERAEHEARLESLNQYMPHISAALQNSTMAAFTRAECNALSGAIVYNNIGASESVANLYTVSLHDGSNYYALLCNSLLNAPNRDYFHTHSCHLLPIESQPSRQVQDIMAIMLTNGLVAMLGGMNLFEVLIYNQLATN